MLKWNGVIMINMSHMKDNAINRGRIQESGLIAQIQRRKINFIVNFGLAGDLPSLFQTHKDGKSVPFSMAIIDFLSLAENSSIAFHTDNLLLISN